ncbi:MAG: Ca-activated chloride channel family protein [Kiritimatiellia bacterium]|jgi:Ca-activated chloride channel family protein
MTTAIPSTVDLPPTLSSLGEPTGLGALIVRMDEVERVLPLQRVRARASIVGAVCRTVIEQTFKNTLTRPLEAIYLFPLPVDGAVTELQLRTGELVVQAECRERQEAIATYARALEQGRRAVLLTQERDDVHTLRVGNLPPGEAITVRIVVIERLQAVDGALRWRFPTVIAPRYLPGEPIGHDGPGVLADSDRVPDGSRLQPPLRLEGGTELDLQVQIAGPVRRLASSLHAVIMELDGGSVAVAPSTRATLNKDFVLSFHPGAGTDLAAVAWTDGAHTVVLCSAPSDAVAPAMPRDAVFVVDVSGSMQGTKMDAAKTALRSAVRGLMPGDRFNIIAFSSSMCAWSEQLCGYDEESLLSAERWISGLRAGGGTAMLEPLKAAMAGETPQGRVRTVLLVTDGQAWDEAQLMAAVGHRRRAARVFTMGIDTAVNESMLRSLARVGGGTCELLTPGDDMEAAVARLEARFGSPVADQVRVVGVVPARAEPRTIFAGRPAYLVVQGAPESVVVLGRTAAGPFERHITPVRVQTPLAALWARERVASLQDRLALYPHEEEGLRPAILDVALQYAIASRYTAFVAVETSRTVDGDVVRVVQAAELPEQWDESAKMESQAFMPPGPVMSSSVKMRGHRVGAVRATGSPPAMSPMSMPVAKAKKRAKKRPVRASRSVGGAFDGLMESAGALFRGAGQEEVAEELDAALMAAPVAAAQVEPGSALAQQQRADGSFGGDLLQTAAALLALLLLGHTRLVGTRRRTVLKAVNYLDPHRTDPVVHAVFAALAAAERGEEPTVEPHIRAALSGVGPAGTVLASLS